MTRDSADTGRRFWSNFPTLASSPVGIVLPSHYPQISFSTNYIVEITASDGTIWLAHPENKGLFAYPITERAARPGVCGARTPEQ